MTSADRPSVSGRVLSELGASGRSLIGALPTLQPRASRGPIGSITHVRRVWSNDRDPCAANLRASALSVPFVAGADVHPTSRGHSFTASRPPSFTPQQ